MDSRGKAVYESLNFPGFESIVVKNIVFSHNLFLRGELENKNLKIDNELSVINRTREEEATSFLAGFVRPALRTTTLPGTFFLHKYKSEKKAFEAEDRVRTFLTAVKIFKNSWCSSNFSFSIGPRNKFYRPFNLTGRVDEIFFSQKNTTLSSMTEFNKIKKIHQRLYSAGFENHLHYSKLCNATVFFNRSYEEAWTLMKTTLAFTAIESLFSDSSKSEVTYKVALRTATFLYPKDFLKRREVFNFIKRGYDIRSYFVHGSDVQKRVETLMKKFAEEKGEAYDFHRNFIQDLEGIVAECLKKILLDEKLFAFFSNEKISPAEESEFYEKLSLGAAL
ncbi:MAG TPA: hypothetical protein VGE53_02595 [Candidatus Paceibacterota bacterium]